MEINYQAEIARIQNFLKSTLTSQGFQKGIIAVSGGVDSALSLILAVKALGPSNVYSLQLPYKDQSVEFSNLIIQAAEIPLENQLKINISVSVDQLAGDLSLKNKHRLGNLMARVRMISLFDQAKKLKALVIGTENKSENLLGYYTRFGDNASDLEPLSHLYKTQVLRIAKDLQLPESIITQPPSAGLWQDQTDEKELGFSYKKADPILSLLVDQKLGADQIVAKDFDLKLVNKIIERLKAVDFKSKVPYSL